jgi:hypothetical protein
MPPEPEVAESMADMLFSGIWTHDYPISVDEVKEMDLQVSTDVPQEVYQLMNMFPQAGRGRPSGVYVPMPYRTWPREERPKSSDGKG